MKMLLAILVGKIIAKLTRLFKIGGGSAAPGLYALKIDPDLVEKLSTKIPANIIITGTNGKTTTARMIAHFAKSQGLRVIRNSTGSNLERGIASALISNYQLPTTNYQLAVWELDEAAFNSVAGKLKPDIVVFLNVFRDQLDRYGEVDSVVKRWSETLSKMSRSTVVLVNGDDVNTLNLRNHFKGKVETFGVEDYKIVGESLEKSSHHKLDFEAKNVKLNGLNGSKFQLTINNELLTINLPIPGLYHIYDAVAALSVTHHLNLPINQLTNQLINFSPAFGRFEKFTLQPPRLKAKQQSFIFLIKNPAGATQVFETIAPQLKPNDRLLLALNDNLADGTDVSWIWDAQFELLLPSLRDHEVAKQSIFVSGSRAHDLAVRLKYAGIEPKSISIELDLKKALKSTRNGLKGRLFILPTYTALLELQKILAKLGIKQYYWKGNH